MLQFPSLTHAGEWSRCPPPQGRDLAAACAVQLLSTRKLVSSCVLLPWPNFTQVTRTKWRQMTCQCTAGVLRYVFFGGFAFSHTSPELLINTALSSSKKSSSQSLWHPLKIQHKEENIPVLWCIHPLGSEETTRTRTWTPAWHRRCKSAPLQPHSQWKQGWSCTWGGL